MLSKDHFTYTGRQLWQWNQDNIAIVLYIKAAERIFFCLVYLAYHHLRAAECNTEWGRQAGNILMTSRFFWVETGKSLRGFNGCRAAESESSFFSLLRCVSFRRWMGESMDDHLWHG